MDLELENGTVRKNAGEADLGELLPTLDRDGNSFAILAEGPETYIQAAVSGDGFLIEKRDGNHEAHFSAKRADTRGAEAVFTTDELVTAFETYLLRAGQPPFLRWEKMRQPHPTSVEAKARSIVPYLILGLVVTLGIAIIALDRF